jgi:predicted O-linked N-acetylglucosamine transferase (SPINDLY family)
LNHAADGLTGRIRQQADIWRNVSALSDQKICEQIVEDRVDILVDLAMHTAKNRVLLFARKAAPIQVTYLAYPSTTGLETIDYRITDPYLDPPSSTDEFYTETSIRLPRTYWCYTPPLEDIPLTSLPADRASFVTFGCLNNSRKLTNDALEAWSQILLAVPDSHLLLHAPSGGCRRRVQECFGRSRISSERIEFFGRVPLQEYMNLYVGIDISLDPFPYVGGTTTCDSLWMGVPVVTLAGRTAIGRGGVSILSNVGLEEFIAESPQDYIRIAVTLANDRPRLAHLRSTIRERMKGAPLMDAKQFAADVENSYRQMWRRWCSGGAAIVGA